MEIQGYTDLLVWFCCFLRKARIAIKSHCKDASLGDLEYLDSEVVQVLPQSHVASGGILHIHGLTDQGSNVTLQPMQALFLPWL